MRTFLYLYTLIWATLLYGGTTIVAAMLRIKRVRGGIYDRCGRNWARQILRAAGVQVTVRGAEHVSQDQPQIVASNHASFFDILAILGYLPVAVKFVAKKELFAIPFFGQSLSAIGHVKLDRTHLRSAFGAYEKAARQVAAQRLNMLIFPEGTRTRTGELQPFKKGPFVLAIAAGVPVVPAYLANTFGIQPKGSIVVHPRPISINLAAPIPTAGMTADDREALTHRVQEAVAALKAAGDGTRVDPARAHG